MGYPIPLGRYEEVRIHGMKSGKTWAADKLVGEDSQRWEILGVASSDLGFGIVVLGKVRVGLAPVAQVLEG